jgi:PmbA protein
VEVVNTRGVTAAYEVTVVGVGATVSTSGGAACRVHLVEVGVPPLTAIEGLVAEIDERLDPPLLEEDPPAGPARVWFKPRAVAALLGPVLSRLAGERWVGGRERFPLLDRRLNLADDPLAAGRPGSRPIDDDGVPTRRLTLIHEGRAVAGILDLVTASRSFLPATGHGWRRGFGAPRIGFSNPVLAPGAGSPDDLAVAVGDGLVVADLRFGPAPNPESGAFRMWAPWTYLTRAGAIHGRLAGVELSGNVFELLGSRVLAVGADAQWVGSSRVPSLVLDGVVVDRC